MRSLNNFLKVEGHSSLVRDMSSNAIIANDNAEFSAYQKRRMVEKNRQELMEKQVNDIENLKNDMLEIKQLLTTLIASRG